MSSNQLAVIGARDLLTEKDIEILKNSKFKGFENSEIDFCAKICTQLQLSPFLNQIHFVKRKNKDGTYSIASQVGIDGFRLAAQRSGLYAGSDEPVYQIENKKPISAAVTVYKMVQGVRCPFAATARWDEYCPAPPNDSMWRKMPFNQLAKCAEALALRKGFPAELSAIYLNEEMDQADKPDKAAQIAAVVQPKPDPKDVPNEPAESESLSCGNCESRNVMRSKFHESAVYCRDCKKTTDI